MIKRLICPLLALLGDQLGRSERRAFVDSVTAGGRWDRALAYDQSLVQYSETVGAINGRCYEAFKQAGVFRFGQEQI